MRESLVASAGAGKQAGWPCARHTTGEASTRRCAVVSRAERETGETCELKLHGGAR